jgi:hypothetical protein
MFPKGQGLSPQPFQGASAQLFPELESNLAALSKEAHRRYMRRFKIREYCRPRGSEHFIETLESVSGRSLKPLQPFRKPIK